MRLGPHLANGDLSPADWAALEHIRPSAVSTMTRHHGADVYRRLEAICRPLYLVRCEPSVEGVRAAVASVPEGIARAGRAYFRVGNEPNIEGLSAEEYVKRFRAIAASVDVPLLVANLSLCAGWREYLGSIGPAIALSDGVALSLYRDDASDPARWLDAYWPYGKPLYGVELAVDYERQERRTSWLRWVLPGLERAGVRASTVYILGGQSNGDWPDLYKLSPVEIEGLASVVREQEAAEMRLSVAVIPSNQDRNLGVINGYSEAGGMAILAQKLTAAFNARGADAVTFAPPLESTDKTQYAALYKTFPAARLWLDKQRAAGNKTLILHLHSDAGGGSHSGYCYSTKRPFSVEMGKGLASRCKRVLDTAKVIGFDTTGWLWDKEAGSHDAAYLEVCAHDVESDLSALYASVDGLAAELVDGTMAWAGAGATPDEAAQLRRENEGLRAENAGLRTKLQQISAIAGSVS